jgi:hypothetical protein
VQASHLQTSPVLIERKKIPGSGDTRAVAKGLHDCRALYIFMNYLEPNPKPIAFTFEKS